MLNVITIIVSKMTSHCVGTAQMREESERGIRKWEEMWFKTTAEDGEKGGSSDVRWKTVPQTSGCDRKRSVTDSGQTITSNDLTYLLTYLPGRIFNEHKLSWVGAASF